MSVIIDGKKIASSITDQIKTKIANSHFARPPGLATILVGDDPASHVYVSNKRKMAKSLGITSIHHALAATTTKPDLLTLINRLNADPNIDGILLQLPLPKHLNENEMIEAIDANKDVDGFHPQNLGYLLRGDAKIAACTPLGVMHLLKSTGVNLASKHAVIVGRSTIVGKPMAHLLLQANATVTICHSHTVNLKAHTQMADILIVAAGKPGLISPEHVKPGAIVIDVGTNRVSGKLVGDVDFAGVFKVAASITPVPGGVGPMTIAMLMQNTLTLFEAHHAGA